VPLTLARAPVRASENHSQIGTRIQCAERKNLFARATFFLSLDLSSGVIASL
jgi:hypothetical protein